VVEVTEPRSRNTLQDTKCDEFVVQSRSSHELCDRNPYSVGPAEREAACNTRYFN